MKSQNMNYLSFHATRFGIGRCILHGKMKPNRFKVVPEAGEARFGPKRRETIQKGCIQKCRNASCSCLTGECKRIQAFTDSLPTDGGAKSQTWHDLGSHPTIFGIDRCILHGKIKLNRFRVVPEAGDPRFSPKRRETIQKG